MRNSLFAAFGLLSIGFLSAFTAENRIPHRVFTLLFPDGPRPVAVEYDMTEALHSAAALRDTSPPLRDRYGDFITNPNKNPVDLADPKAIEQVVEYDPVTNSYILFEKIGDEYYRAPTYMTFEEYVRWRDKQQQQEYFDRLQGVVTPGKKSTGGIVDPIAKFDIQNSLIDRLFGGTNVDIKPQGNINLTFGVDYQKLENPILTLRQQRQTNFDFDMDINMSAQGKIGEKLNLNFNYNTQATFDFDNQMKLNYDPKNFSEDEIIQGIQAGNVSMPLRSNLIKGAQNLFGVKVDMKFGHLRTTLLASQQRSKQQNLNVQGGSSLQVFEKPADEYDENRHFFLSHWNRGNFEPAMSCLPVPQSLFRITRLEVWITNDKLQTTDTRDIAAIADLAEPEPLRRQFGLVSPPQKDIKGKGLADNKNNDLYPAILDALGQDSSFRFSDRIIGSLRGLPAPQPDSAMKQIRDFEKVRARLLSPQEYSFSEDLGFVSINLNVQPDQVVGVAYEYTYNGEPHKVGEFTSDVPVGDSLNQNVLIVKMLKSTTANVQFPIWDLMMKNVYAVGAANVDPNEFVFDIFYEDPGKGQKRFLGGDGNTTFPSSLSARPLLQVFNLDNLNLQNDPGADGRFDYVPGLTFNQRTGRVMFPVLEPFGSYLQKKILDAGGTNQLAAQYIYPQLYDSTLFRAREFQQLNRFTLKGSYKSTSNSEISLGTFNLPPGSVRVSAGAIQMIEGRDYIVDYNIGKVRILNDAVLQSGQNVSISFEDNTLFGFQNRTMIGARFDYDFSKDFTIGGTFMNLFERPLTQKVNFGDDPINNKVYGLDMNISKEAPWLTKLVDKIPFLDTKEASTITAQAEVALLDPGTNRAINLGGEPTIYIDDFEGASANVPLGTPANSWIIASTPQGNTSLFPEGELTNDLRNGVNRSRLSWYVADPSAIDGVDGSNPYSKRIPFQDIFPNRQLSPLEQSNLRSLDVTIYPRERGPYNFDLPNGYPGISEGLSSLDGSLNRPETRWAGFMRGLNNNNDFEASNIEFVEFWMLNPYMDKGDGSDISEAGEMYLDLGSISEDVMRDSRQFFENALPTTPDGPTVPTAWGRVPVLPPVVNSFVNDNTKRPLQDIGLDGLNDDQEKATFADWVSAIGASGLPLNVVNEMTADPSNDNFVYFGDERFGSPGSGPGLLERYRKFNNPQGNSPENNNAGGGNSFFTNPSATNIPDMEDLNRDNSLNETEAYFRYRIPMPKTIDAGGQEIIDRDDPEVKDLITDVRDYVDDNGDRFLWYRFKVPLDYLNREGVGGIQDFRSIRFMRMLWKGFTERTTFRFATLELGRNQWRRYSQNLSCVPEAGFDRSVGFDVNAVSVEENSARTPFSYTIPDGIQRERSVGAFPDILQNEQALSMTVCGLDSCDARGIFKTLNMDLRQFDRVKMFVHAEGRDEGNNKLEKGDLKVFIRMGSDFVNNYYEYEIPVTPSDATLLTGSPEDRSYKLEVWRPEMDFDFPLEIFTTLKSNRNQLPNWPLSTPYEESDPERPDNKVRVVGNPNLGYVKNIMIGAKNVDPEGREKCFEMWFNELRLSGFTDQGGFAGMGRVDMKLADFGNLSLSGNYSSIGYGSIEQKVVQRQREEIIQYDVSTNMELGKFFGEKAGIKLPLLVQYSNTTKNPEYDPYDLDIKLKDKLDRETDATKRRDIREKAQDVSVTKGYNFTNVRKERKGSARKVPLPWNIENFSLSYGYTERTQRTPFIQLADQDQYKGALDWQYNTGIKPISPFKKAIKKDKYLKFITDFNLNPIPNSYGFNTNLERFSSVTTYRFAGEDPKLNTYYNRRFTWDRNYDLGWDIAKSLRFNFDATARSIIDEPLQFNNDGTEVTREQRRDSIVTNLRKLGRPKNYNHTASLNWTLPFKSIPMMDFVTMKASYTAGYTWTAQSLKLQNMDAGTYANIANERNLGHVIQNNNTRQINGDLNFETLYNKSKYLSKINRGGSGAAGPGGKGGRNNSGPGGRGADPETGGGPGGLPGGGPGALPGGKGKDGKIADSRDKAAGKDGKGKDSAGKTGAPGSDPGTAGSPDDPASAGGAIGTAGKGKKAKGDRQPSLAERIALRPLMLVRKARFNYTENLSTVVPGFTPETKLMGLSEGFSAPGWAFVAGIQPKSEWLDDAASKGWITHRPELNQQVMRNYTQTFDVGLTVEPFKDFRVEVTANRQYSRNSTELFKDTISALGSENVFFDHRAQRDLGSFTTSYFALQTLFNNDINGLFDKYSENRKIISKRLGVEAGNTDDHEKDEGYVYGYGKIHQEVLIPSFISAYTNKDPNTVGLDIFKTLPAPNWKLTYNGLSKVGKLSKVFSSIQIAHGYKGTMTVNQYNTDLFYEPATPYTVDELNYNYIARFEIPQVVINEQFAPLFSVDVKLKNEMTFKADYKKSRTLALSFIDYQLAETRSTSYTGGFGYRMKNVNIPFLTGKKALKAKAKSSKKKKKKTPPPGTTTPPAPGGTTPTQGNDLNFKFDFEVRDDITVNHRLDLPVEAEPTRGARTISINPSVEYALSQRLKLRLFTDYRKTVPKTSQSFPITTINGGVTVQFSLSK
ncbi:MAG: cell surface protein SprA [Saprospiraceae bacterium]|nr:cell surface protein SprA [Saprospiraceae bacterium]